MDNLIAIEPFDEKISLVTRSGHRSNLTQRMYRKFFVTVLETLDEGGPARARGIDRGTL